MKNEYKINKALMMSWAKRYIISGAANVVLFVLWILIGIIGLALIALLLTGGGDPLDWYIAILFLFLSVFKLFVARFIVISKRFKVYSRLYGVSEWTRTTEFTDSEISVTDHTSASTKIRYESLKKSKNTETRSFSSLRTIWQ